MSKRKFFLAPDELKSLYCDERLSMGAIAKQIGCSLPVVWKWMIKFNITRRNRSEAHSLVLGEQNPAWKGGRILSGQYYRIRMPNHPRANNGYVQEHVLIWERTHNRLLPQGWIVHHINGIKTDNRPRNLLALLRKDHHGLIVLQEAQKRIRELEAEVKLLEKTLEANQEIFYSEN